MKTTTFCVAALLLQMFDPSDLNLVAAEKKLDAAAGHWEGSIALPTTPLSIRVDLDREKSEPWSGTIDIPVQGLRAFKLSKIVVDGEAVSFAMPGIPGDPEFAGKLSADGKLMAGDFTQGGQSFRFTLDRKPRPVPTAAETPAKGVPGKGLVGYWQGSLKPSPIVELRLVLEVTNSKAGMLEGTMISVDQGGVRIPVAPLTETSGAVHLETKSVGGAFDGRLSGDGSEISGDWKQGGNTLPLLFKRLPKAPKLGRNQEPNRPYPYRDEEVVVQNPAAGVTLAGTLTIPQGNGPFPAVVLITGSGPQDRDEAIMGHRPFLVLADHLTRNGIAVLRYDDRGIGKSTGNFSKATNSDFVEDTLAIVSWLKTRKEVDPRRIGLVGHSEGGVIAPRAAVKSTDVAFIVLLAGVGVPTSDLLSRQGRDLMRVMGADESTIERNSSVQQEIFRLLNAGKDAAETEKNIRELFRQQIEELTPEQRAALGYSDSAVDSQIQMVMSPWFRDLLRYDPRPTLRQVKCPVLAINGEKDLQVSAKENLAAIREALAAGGNAKVRIVETPGLNHLFQTCSTGAIAEYAQIEETIAPSVLQLISSWILGQTGV
jgi:pimeloyl-ACP methyl ester carboxylesterase